MNKLNLKEVNTLQELIKTKLKSNETLPFETKQVIYKKNALIIGPGMIEKNIYFIASGMVKSSITSLEGNETLLSFYFPGQMFSSLSSFITQKPTVFNFICITDCVLEIIPREALHNAMKHSILANDLYKYYFEFTYLMRIKIETDRHLKSASERYLDLINQYPEIIKQFPVKTIASYLSIHPKSLSRLKKDSKFLYTQKTQKSNSSI